MGTRNLTQVIHKGKVRMAQYGQWDGYLQGVGKDIAKVLQKTTLKDLRSAISKCVFIDGKKVDGYYRDAGSGGAEWVTMEVSDAFKLAHPLLHRDYSGGAALSVILKDAESKKRIELQNQSDFAADSIFCQWAYVIDLDKKKVEIYRGYNTLLLSKKDRFFYLQKRPNGIQKSKATGEMFYPVRLLRTYAIKDFTTKALDKLVKEMNKEEEASA